MERPIRLFVETLVIFVAVEAAIMLLLPVLAPGVGVWLGALLDTALLTLIAGPLVFWRAARAERGRGGG